MRQANEEKTKEEKEGSTARDAPIFNCCASHSPIRQTHEHDARARSLAGDKLKRTIYCSRVSFVGHPEIALVVHLGCCAMRICVATDGPKHVLNSSKGLIHRKRVCDDKNVSNSR